MGSVERIRGMGADNAMGGVGIFSNTGIGLFNTATRDRTGFYRACGCSDERLCAV